MKKIVLMLAVLIIAVGCSESIQLNDENKHQISNVNFTPCVQNTVRNAELSSAVNVKFTSEGVQITHFNFEVHCDFTTVNVTHTFVNGVLNITQQGDGNARCICYTDVSYTINAISKNEVNVIFINGEQVYCYNDKDDLDFCSYLNLEDISKTIPIINEFLAGLPNGISKEQTFESLETWLNSFPCNIDAKILIGVDIIWGREHMHGVAISVKDGEKIRELELDFATIQQGANLVQAYLQIKL